MSKLSNMLKKEYINIKDNQDIGKRNDCKDILISARFEDNHVHHILPSKQVTDMIVDDLLSYTSENFNKNLISNNKEVKENIPPKEVIFHNRQAFGDILTMTCVIRDFKKQFQQTRVGVHTTAMHIWDNNPNIDHTFRMGSLSANNSVVKIGPGFLTNKSGMWDYHMCNAFRMDIQNKLNLKISQGPIRPDIWLTEEEYNREPIIKGPYWIFIYGGEPGWPSKQYHRWQEVINILKDDIKFVQLGVKKHPYPVLDNVIDYVGKTEDRNTGIRDLFNIFLHAQGSLGLVSMHMHLSAAFNNPCVTKDTLIMTENGLNFPVNLIDKKFNAVVDGKLYNSNGFWKTGNKKILQLNFKSGKELNVTDNHKIMTEEGWKESKNIKIGEKIKINNHRNYNFNLDFGSRDYAKGYLLGNLLSDGHVNRTSAVVMWFDKDRNKYYKDGLELMDQAGWALSRRLRAKDNGVSRRISSLNLYDFAVEKGCIDDNGKKTFTKKTLIGSWSYLSGLIAGYFDGDGTVGNYNNGNFNLSIASVNYTNLKLIQLALNCFGIGSRIYKDKKCRLNTFANKNKIYNSKCINRIVVSGDDIKEFIDKIYIRNEDKLSKIKKIEKIRTRKARINRFFDILVDVKEKKEENVYDCEVDEIHAFDANSFYVHNCVVVAGAREPASFTQYFGHQYIHTNGTLVCSEKQACWACKLEGCRNLVDPINKPTNGHNTIKVPKCVDIIEPEEIAESIRKYYKGGRLEYGKKIKNTFFNNIVKEKKIFSISKTEEADEDLLKKYGFEWGGGSITDKDWMFISEVLKSYNIKNILEFGAGLSTLLFSTKVDNVITFETQDGWIEKIQEMSDNSKNHFFKWDGKSIDINLNDFKENKFDLAFVDGPAGGQNREFSTMYASSLSNIVIIHDAGREWERKWQEKYLSKDFEMVSKGGHRCHLWVKKEISKARKEEAKKLIDLKIADDYRKSFRMVTTCRGFGGSERSSLFIMKDMLKRGYRVELIPTGNVSGEYSRNIPEDVIVRPWEDIVKPIDILTFYTSDCIWNFNKPQYLEVMDKLNCGKKIMILNYQLGGAGNVDWTKDWNLYMFLNSTKEKELKERISNAKTKILPPPTDLTEFFKVNIDYGNGLRLIRHNSQRDTKWPEYSNDLINQIWNEVDENIEFYSMPARSNCIDDRRIHKFKVNEISVPEFLSKGNCFWYHIGFNYQDQGPRVALEAAAYGLPLIGDNSYGMKDRITTEIGWLCNSLSDYLDVISDINKDLTILEKKGKEAKEYAKENFIGEKWGDFIIEI